MCKSRIRRFSRSAKENGGTSDPPGSDPGGGELIFFEHKADTTESCDGETIPEGWRAYELKVRDATGLYVGLAGQSDKPGAY
jgi:hypothetical protein